jgi:alanine racemase
VADDLARNAETDSQRDAFIDAVRVVEELGLDPGTRHVANTAAALSRRDLYFDMVRVGIGLYGLSPFALGSGEDGLRPAMTLTTRLAQIKTVPPGQGVSYGYDFVASRSTTLGLVPVGYADGIPRAASGAEVRIRGVRYPVVGRIAMDQFVVDLTAARLQTQNRPQVDDPVEVFGPDGVTANEWATAAGTINYEIVTRIGPRVDRIYTT